MRYLCYFVTGPNDLEWLGCKGLENKFNDVGDADKFDSTVSELEVAKILLNQSCAGAPRCKQRGMFAPPLQTPVSYTHLRAHETPEHLVCRLLLEKKKNTNTATHPPPTHPTPQPPNSTNKQPT